MQIVETLNEGLKRAYTLTIAAKDISKRVEQEVARLAPQIRMPGFRPGKVPANLVKKMHGEAIQGDALNASVQEAVQTLIADQKLRPAMSPSVELAEGYSHGKDAELSVALEILPEIAAPSIDGLKLERLTIEASVEAVDEAVLRIAQQQKAMTTHPRATRPRRAISLSWILSARWMASLLMAARAKTCRLKSVRVA